MCKANKKLPVPLNGRGYANFYLARGLNDNTRPIGNIGTIGNTGPFGNRFTGHIGDIGPTSATSNV